MSTQSTMLPGVIRLVGAVIGVAVAGAVVGAVVAGGVVAAAWVGPVVAAAPPLQPAAIRAIAATAAHRVLSFTIVLLNLG